MDENPLRIALAVPIYRGGSNFYLWKVGNQETVVGTSTRLLDTDQLFVIHHTGVMYYKKVPVCQIL
jgi:hypothetical protein